MIGGSRYTPVHVRCFVQARYLMRVHDTARSLFCPPQPWILSLLAPGQLTVLRGEETIRQLAVSPHESSQCFVHRHLLSPSPLMCWCLFAVPRQPALVRSALGWGGGGESHMEWKEETETAGCEILERK